MEFSVEGYQAEDGDAPIELDKEQFFDQIMDLETHEVKTEGAWFVKFYAPWCQHCKSLAPTWDKLAANLKGKVKVAKVNCDGDDDDDGKEVCAMLDVKAYPTLLMFTPSEYDDGRKKLDYERY
jgi:thioredoxin-like negative regulator of GroEL